MLRTASKTARRWAALGVATVLAACGSAQVPPGGVSMLGNDPLGSLTAQGPMAGELLKMQTIDVQGQPFQKALRLETVRRPGQTWEVQLGASFPDAVAVGDVVLVSLYARANRGQPETGEATIVVDFQKGSPDWDVSGTLMIGVTKEWKRYDLPVEVSTATPAGGSRLQIQLGFGPQEVEIGGLSVLRFPSGTKLADLPRTRSTYAGMEPDAAWRKEAAERIEKIRKGDLKVTVRDAQGRAVEGAHVQVEMTRHAFPFGSCVAANLLTEQSPDAERYREFIVEHYNQVSIENHLKWPFWEEWAREDGIKGVDWLNQQGIPVRGHTLVWPGYGNLPADIPSLAGDPDALRKRIRDHLEEIVTQFRGKLVEWDALNEPFANNDLMKILGDEAMIEWFKLARQFDPEVRLIINDYPPLDGGAVGNTHLDHYERTIRFLIDGGAPVEGIGFQCHIGGQMIPPARLLSGLDRFAKFGLPIVITEFDMNTTDRELQAQYMRDFMTAMFSHPALEGVIMWGFWEGAHWFPQAALYNRDWSIRPHGQAWLDLVKDEWWTRESGRTGASGAMSVRGFYGDYRITVSHGGTQTVVEASLRPGEAGEVTVQLP